MRRAGFAGILITLACALAAPVAPADRRPQPSAEELWRSYPLEQKPTTTAAPAPAAPAPPRASAPAADASSDSSPPWGLLAAIAAAGTALVALILAWDRRRSARAHEPAPPASSPPADASPAGRAIPAPPGGVRTAAAVTAPVASRAVRPDTPRAREAGAARPDNGRPPAPHAELVCRIRWSRRAKRFFAVTVDAAGAERRLGRSPVIDWAQPGPPEETPEAQAAVRQLAKEMRERGWRPLRARGLDFDERRWYARRFRRPTEAESDGTGPDEGAPSPDVADRRGARG